MQRYIKKFQKDGRFRILPWTPRLAKEPGTEECDLKGNRVVINTTSLEEIKTRKIQVKSELKELEDLERQLVEEQTAMLADKIGTEGGNGFKTEAAANRVKTLKNLHNYDVVKVSEGEWWLIRQPLDVEKITTG